MAIWRSLTWKARSPSSTFTNKIAVYENKEIVKALLQTLNTKAVLDDDNLDEDEEHAGDLSHYINSFYLIDSSIYVEAACSSSSSIKTF